MNSEFYNMLTTLKTENKEFAILLGNQPTRVKIQFMSGDYVMIKILDMNGAPVAMMHWSNLVVFGVAPA